MSEQQPDSQRSSATPNSQQETQWEPCVTPNPYIPPESRPNALRKGRVTLLGQNLAQYVNTLEADKRALESQLSALRTRAEEAERERDTYRAQRRIAWGKLGCRCLFDDEDNKVAEDPHCPYHGTQQRDPDEWDPIGERDEEIARLKAERDACLNREEGYRKYIQAHSDDESRITELTALAARGALADSFRDRLREIKPHRDKPDYVARELAQALNSFEANYDALTTPDAGKEVQERQ